MRRASILLLLFALSSISGCGGDPGTARQSEDASGTAPTGTAAPAGTRSFETPEDAYAALASAAKNEDWTAAASVLTPESQAMMAAGMIMGASFMTMGDEGKQKELTALLGKHGIDLEDETSEPSEAASPADAMMELTQPVEDIPVFLGQLAAWMDKNGDSSGGGFAELGELGDIKIEGETAKAVSQTDMGPQPVEFRQIDGNWLVHLPLDAPAPELSDGGWEEPDDGTPGLGTIWIGDKTIKLRHATAYKSKFFDDPCTVVLLTARPIRDRELNDLKEMLKSEGSDEAFFVSGPNVKLSLDADGKLLFMFAWVDNHSINRNGGVDVDVQIEDDRVHGKAQMIEPDEIAGTDYRFEATFDTEMIGTD